MKSRLLANLAQLPPLSSSNQARGAASCKICGGPSPIFDIVDFNKISDSDFYQFGFAGIPVLYYRCCDCGLIFTTFCDYWTTEDFAAYIYNSDYPLVDGEYSTIRPARIAVEMAGFLAAHRADRILDYGSGAGVFAERLRAGGFAAIENYDPFASPQRPRGQFDIITCFETIEHSPFPKQTIVDLVSFLAPGGCIIFSTGIQPADINEVRANWWYIAPRNGHVSIYTLPALTELGASAGLDLHVGDDTLAFAGPTPSPQLIPLLRLIGPTRAFARFTAPAGRPSPHVAAREADWHAIEQSGQTRFRWTQSNRVQWTLHHQPGNYPCRLTVTIPVVNEIIPGFADQCVLEIASTIYKVRRENSSITATVELDHSLQQPIVLITPEPRRPSEVRGTSDDRALGLAIPLAAGNS